MIENAEPRVPTYLWVEAKIKELNATNIPAYIIHRGEKMDGVILFKISDCQGQCTLKTRQRNFDGELEWGDVFGDEIVDETKADEYITRSKDRDPDLWCVEVEHPQMDLIID